MQPRDPGQPSELRLTPVGHLRWVEAGEPGAGGAPEALRARFDADWRDGLFALAAERPAPGASLSLRYWQGIAEALLTRLCHLPGDATPEQAETPSEADLSRWVLAAPPMQGGEYLSASVLRAMWDDLVAWCVEEARSAGGLHPWLGARAPRWRQVGRVCFHLAENKADPARPFAFLATYVAGLGAEGRDRHLPLRRALEEYAGRNNRRALVKLLTPVQAAAERLDWVKEMVDSREVYQAVAWPPGRAHRFLLDATTLEECGLAVRVPDWWRKRAHPRVSVTLGEAPPTGLGLESMLDFDVRVALGDEALTDSEVAALLNADGGLIRLRGNWVEVDQERLREALDHWLKVEAEVGEDGLSFLEGMRLLAGASRTLRDEGELETIRPWTHVRPGADLRRLLQEMREPATRAADDEGLRTKLRPYQRRGVAWLHFLTRLGLGACLADDMGLGKTVQVLALLLRARRTDPSAGPALLVVPASLMGNWEAEAARFAPELRLAFLHPSRAAREELARIQDRPPRALAEVDLAVTTYSMLSRQPWLADTEWRLVILDEAQAIKNPGTAQARAAKKLPACARVAMTGTPVENRLGDLWSIFDFLNPGLLGSAGVFQSFIKSMEVGSEEQFAPLRRLVAPYILRRMKTDRSIISELPDKIEATRYCGLTRAQVRLYGRVVGAMRDALEQGRGGIERRAMVLQTLMRLKQLCNHPSQLTGDGAYAPEDSGKFQRLAEIAEELAERQERVLIFTQFREIIDPLAMHLGKIFGRPGLVLHGGTAVRKRSELVDRFQREDGPPFFVLSLKAGGTGLNLTAANHVVHFDRWWNPAVEDQATDRAFRIGQRRGVLVHKFVVSGSVEERIDAMIADKRRLAREVLGGAGEVDVTSMDDDALIELVSLDVARAMG